MSSIAVGAMKAASGVARFSFSDKSVSSDEDVGLVAEGSGQPWLQIHLEPRSLQFSAGEYPLSIISSQFGRYVYRLLYLEAKK